MEEECTIVGEVGKKGFGSPPLKKLKQSRLPFAPLDSKTPQKNSSPNNQKKRKLSGSELSQNSPKTPRSENNSMSETPVSDRKLQTPKSVGSATKDKSKQGVTPTESTKKRGRGRPPKTEKEKEESKRAKQASYQMTSDDEVSSSVDDDVDVPEAKKKPVEKTRKLLSAFMSKEPTQQAEVTTSTDDVDKEEMEQEDKENKDCTSEEESGRGEMEISSKDDSPVEEASEGGVDAASKEEEKPEENTKVESANEEENKKSSKKSSPLIDMLKAKKTSNDAKNEKAVKEKAVEEQEGKSGKEEKVEDKLEKEDKVQKKPAGAKKEGKQNMIKAEGKKEMLVGKKKEKGAEKLEKKESDEKLTKDSKEKTESKEAVIEKKDEVEVKKTNETEAKEKPKSEEKGVEKGRKILKNKGQEVETKAESKKASKEEAKTDDKTEKNEEEVKMKKKADGGKTDSDSNNEEKNEEGHDSKEEKKENEEGSESKEEKENEEGSESKEENNEGNESTEEMEVDLDASGSSKSDGTGSANTSPVATSKSSDKLEVPMSSGQKTPVSIQKAKKLTPKQIAKEAERQQKREEREKLRKEREKKKQEELAEKERIKKQKEEERQKAKEEKEKAKEEQKRKRQEEIEAKKQKKEEEQQLKEVERMIREEEARLAQEEKQKQKDKLKNKFASFFVAKKRDLEEAEEKSSNGNFKEFRVKEDMQLAPLVRTNFTEDRRTSLNEYLTKQTKDSSETYLSILKTGIYAPCKSQRTWPFENKKEEVDDDIEIIEDEDGDMDAGDSMVQETESDLNIKTVKAKLLKFCENRRPAYWGTWSKKSKNICARRPFARDDIFNYEYDSDDDWEEEETGESLSDSEGEEKEEEEGDQYEVDNDFFVPHGYLSDDEGKSDQEEEEENGQEEDNGSKHKEQLKQKQAEFEEEMKKKTKHLKPRVIGSLWMADANNNPAFNQLLKILNPHKAVTLGTSLPIGTRHGGVIPKDTKEQKDDDEGSTEDKGNAKKFCKTFPEEAVPALIKLVHGNRNGKAFLSREFSDFWRKLQAGELDEEQLEGIPMLSSPIQASMFLARKKVESKIQELGHWRKCPEEGPFSKVMMWYVSKQVREEHGVADITVPNSWNYINKPKEKREVNFEDPDTMEESKSNKAGKLTPITAFTKKLPTTPSSANTSPTSTPATTPQTLKSNEGSPSSASLAPVTPSRNPESPPNSTGETPSGKSGTPGHPKKKVALFSVPRNQEITDAQKASFVSFFKKNAEKSPVPTKSDSTKDRSSEKTSQPDPKKDDDDIQCITLD